MNLTFNLRDAAAPLIGERRFDMDMPLLVGAVALLALGLVMVTSASMEVAAGRLGSPRNHQRGFVDLTRRVADL